MNPFPGLRPFKPEESYLFFGRQNQIDAVLHRLREHEFLAVVGTSGSGKSSLVRAGLLPVLYGGFLTKVGSAWRVAILRPGDDPIHNLALALNENDVFGPQDPADLAMDTAITEAVLTRGALGLVEVVSQARMAADENLLIFVDQFEEVFRFKTTSTHAGASDAAAAFVKLLIEAVEQEQYPIHVLLTLRSDYLGDCAQFHDLPEMMNDSQYLVPRMSRDEMRQAIEGPVAVGGGRITPALVNRLLNDVGDNQDQLPVLQHALMRTWDCWQVQHLSDHPLDLEHYQHVGGMADALSLHADEIYDSLSSDELRRITEILFKRLTDRGTDNRGIRRPASLHEVCAVADAGHDDVITVVEEFRAPGRTFLMPPVDDPLPLCPNTLLDISHESLMRNWKRLRDWVEDEAQCARIYRRLAETAQLHTRGEAGLLDNPELAVDEFWLKKWSTNPEWAERYASNYQESMTFLQASITQRQQQKAEREQRQRQELDRKNQEIERINRWRRRFKLLSAALGGFAVMSIATGVWAMRNYRWAMRGEVEGLMASSDRLETLGSPEDSLAEMLKAGRVLQKHSRWHVVPLIFGDGLQTEVKAKLARRLFGVIPRFPPFAPDNARGSQQGRRRAEREVKALAFSDDGSLLAYADDHQTIGLVRADTVANGSEPELELLFEDQQRSAAPSGEGQNRKSNGDIFSLTFSPDKSHIVATTDGKLLIWDRRHRNHPKLTRVPGTGGWRSEVAFRGDGAVFAAEGSEAGTIQLWRVDGTPITVPKPVHENRLMSLSFSGSNPALLVSSDFRGNVRLWDRATNTIRDLPHQFSGRVAARFSPSGKTIALAGIANEHLQIVLIDPVTLRTVSESESQAARRIPNREVSRITFLSNRDDLLATSSPFESNIRIWQVDSQHHTIRKLEVLAGDRNPRSNISISPHLLASHATGMEGRFVTSNSRGEISIWNFGRHGDTAEVFALPHHSGPITTVSLQPQGRLFAAAGSDGMVTLWNAGDPTSRPRPFAAHSGAVRDVAFSPDGRRIATAGEDGTVKFWDPAGTPAGPVLRSRQGSGSGAVVDLSFSPSGRRIAALYADHSIRIWRTDGEVLWTSAVSPQGKRFVALSFGADDLTLFAADAVSFARLDFGTPKPAPQELSSIATAGEDGKGRPALDESNGIRRFELSRDGDTIISSHEDGTLRFWGLRPDRQGIVSESELSMSADGDPVSAMSVSSDDGVVVIPGNQARVLHWRLDIDQMLERGCEVLERYRSRNKNVDRRLEDVGACRGAKR